MARRKKKKASSLYCDGSFIGENNEDDSNEDEDEDEDDNSQSSDEQESDDSESEEESEASDVGEEYEEAPPKKAKTKVVVRPPVKWHTAKVNIKFTGSLRGLSMNPSLSIVKLDANSPAIFEGDMEIEPGAKKSTNHQIGGITISRYKNDFDVSLHLSTTLIDPKGHRSHDTSGNSGVFTFYPHESVSSIHEEICGQIGDPESSLLSKYPDYNLDTLDKGITHVDDPSSDGVKYSLIPKGHPLVELFNQNDGRNARVRPVKQLDNAIKASTENTKQLLELLKEETKKKVKGVNLYDSEFSIQRAFVANHLNDGESWKAEDEIFDNLVFDQSKEDGLDAIRSLYVDMDIKYKLL